MTCPKASPGALNSPIPTLAGDPPSDALAPLRRVLEDLHTAGRALNTRKAYASAFGRFRAWADAHHLPSLPSDPETVALYLAHLARLERKSSTAERALSAISQTHTDRGFPSPCASLVVRRAMKGLRRLPGVRATPRRALLASEIAAMVEALPRDLIGLRDRALLTLGFATGLRRSELVALDVSDLALTNDGSLLVTIHRSKTDQEGHGRRVRASARVDAACPLLALMAWGLAAKLEGGALFRSIHRGGHLTSHRLHDKGVERIVKRAASLAGVDASRLSGHSLRSGFATEQARSGVTERLLMKRLGHSSPSMTRRYIQTVEED